MKIKSVICVLVSLCVLMGTCLLGGCQPSSSSEQRQSAVYRNTEGEYDSLIKSAYDFTVVAENEQLQLLVNGTTAEIKVVNKASGAEWYSNPQSRYGENATVGASLDMLGAQVFVDYNVSDKTMSYNSCTDAVWESQYCFEEVQDGLRVNFLLGKKPKVYFVPKIMSVERYEQLMAALDEAGQNTINAYYRFASLEGLSEVDRVVYEENYPILKERDVYIALLTDNLGSADGVFASDYLMKQLNDVFVSAGYTEEMYYADNEENLVDVARVADTTIALSVVYSIAGGAFTASIPNDSVSFDSTSITPMSITLLPYFGAADQQQEGYMLVPDGSGAIIRLNSAKYSVTEYVKRVYGRDYAVTDEETADLDIEQIHLPVFGMRQSSTVGMQGFLAVIEQGDALAEIHANISGKVSAYNTVSSTFLVNQTQKASDQTLGVTLGLRYQKENAASDLTIRYMFIDGDASTYTGMARCYRQYLTERNQLNSAAIDESIPLYVSTIGAVDAIKTVAGIPMNTQVSLTSYEQNIRMMKDLQAAGIVNLVWNTEAWSNNGVRNTPFSKLSVSGALGGKNDYRELVAFAAQNGVALFSQAKLQTVNVDGLLDGFSRSKQAARNLENATAYESDYSLVTRSYDEENRRIIVSPKAYGDMLSDFLKAYQKYGNAGVDLDTLGYRLNGDYYEDDLMDRQEAKQAVVSALTSADRETWSFAAEGANAYTLQALDFAYNIPTRSSREYIFDECVPFFQTVVHGLIPYAGRPMNLSSEYDVEALRLIETGTIPAFMWIYEDNSVLKNTDFNFYSVSYQTWTERASALYKTVNDALNGVAQASIVSHEYLTDNVVCTGYDNGIKIYVNYGNTDYQTEDGVVPAVGYLRIG